MSAPRGKDAGTRFFLGVGQIVARYLSILCERQLQCGGPNRQRCEHVLTFDRGLAKKVQFAELFKAMTRTKTGFKIILQTLPRPARRGTKTLTVRRILNIHTKKLADSELRVQLLRERTWATAGASCREACAERRDRFPYQQLRSSQRPTESLPNPIAQSGKQCFAFCGRIVGGSADIKFAEVCWTECKEKRERGEMGRPDWTRTSTSPLQGGA